MATAGAQTVTVAYNEGEVTKTATYGITVNAPATLTSITLSGTYPTAFDQGDAFSSAGIVVTANFDDNTTSDVTSEAIFSGYDMSTLGEQTVTVSYGEKTATYTITVNEKKGTADNPYTVAEARAAIDANTGVTSVYATGIVSAIPTAWNTQFNNITFNFVDTSGDTDFLQAYRCVSTTDADASTVAVGDIVVVKGNLTKYNNSTYEFASGCQLISITHPTVAVATPTFSPAVGAYSEPQDVTISCATDGADIYYTTDGTEPDANSTPYTGAIHVTTTTTFKAIAYKGGESSTVAKATYHITSVDNPYTVSQALGFDDSEYPIEQIYVHGIVSTAPTQAPTSYGQLTYYISDDGTTTNQLQVYKGQGLNAVEFTAQDDIQVGDEVTIIGNVKIYNNIKEFDSGNYLVSFNRPVVTTPTITANPSSLTGFTYEEGNGPSAAQQITIGGLNQTDGCHATLDDNSSFECSFSEDGEYFSDSGFGTNPNQNVIFYVRMKSGLDAGNYYGTITITSAGAETVTVDLSGSVTAPEAPSVTWDLSIASYDEVTDVDIVTWSSTCATMTNITGTASTKASNYLGGDSNNRTSTRFYNGNNLTITPAAGYSITSIEFEATSTTYAGAFGGSDWTNASAFVSGTTVTVTPY